MADRLTAEFSMETIGGRKLRVARWRWNQPSEHPPVLFFNGIGTNIEAVAPLAEALNDRAFIMYDMPGIGGSPDPLVPYNPFTVACQARELLDRFGAGQVDVMGLSWGGGIAQQFALQHPGRARRLVLIATTAGMLMVPGMPSAPAIMADPRHYFDPETISRHFQSIYGGVIGVAGKDITRFQIPSPQGLAYQLLAMLGWTSAPALPFLTQPTLIIMGADDQIVPPANGHLLNTLIPDSRMEVVEGGGHLFILSHIDQTVARLRSFLGGSTAKARRAA